PTDPCQTTRLLRGRTDETLGVQGLAIAAVRRDQVVVGLRCACLTEKHHSHTPPVIDTAQQGQRGVVVLIGRCVITLPCDQGGASAQTEGLSPLVTALTAQSQRLLHS